MLKKNGSILGFFKPVSSQSPSPSLPEPPPQPEPGRQAQTPPKTQSKPRPNAQTPSRRTEPTIDILDKFSSPASLPSSQPSNPPAPSVKPLSRDAEIKGSDDEDDDSDWSMDDLDTLIRRTQAIKSPENPSNPCITPKAKRIAAFDFHSPMSIRAKHRFDMKALQSHAENDSAREESAARVAALFAKEKEERIASARKADTGATKAADPHSTSAGNKQDQVIAMINAEENEELDKERLKRAVLDTKIVATTEQWYFFQANPSKPARDQFPKATANGRWRFLRDDNTRRDYFVDGLALQMLDKKNDLPDEIFMWIMAELCVDVDETVRSRYMDLLSMMPEQVRRLVDLQRLSASFRQLGSRYESTDLSEELEPSGSISGMYAGRDWSRLRSLLKTLSRIAPHMDLEGRTCAVQLLLRLGLDTLIIENLDIYVDYQDAFQELVSTVPISSWERFCEEVCSSLYLKVAKHSLRRQALACIPSGSPKPHELRRRLASTFLFDDIAQARQNPEANFSVVSALDRLNAPEFQVNNKTDYDNLAALVWFVDIFVDDGSRGSYHSQAAQEEFNSGIDRLVAKLKHIWRCIGMPSPNHVAKLESKAVLECVQHRLTYSVRTKRPQRQKLFDTEKLAEDKSLPKQRELMRNFFQKKPQVVNVAATA